eukprot:GDKK01006767.1.p1 GENE.GDKK01006767.1~~GDKK01006767.1.p1  ORF type:complete len:111 (+),score=22.93 GDKK01006767.1:1-333(+)
MGFPSLSTTPALPGSGASSADIHDPSTVVGQWFARKTKSLVSEEWQLFNNGPIANIIDAYISFPKTLLRVTDDEDNEDNANIGGGMSHEELVAHAMEEADDDLGALLDGL